MKLRLSANTWILIVLFGIIVVVGSETARAYLKGEAGAPSPPPTKPDPDFKVGDAAPEFSLPDKLGKRHSLSSLVKGDTVLCFICGCGRCRQAQTYLGELQAKMGPNAPRVISVSSTDPVAEEAYKRDVKLDHLMLYERKANPDDTTDVGDTYHGHPCPRMFRLAAGRKVVWIGHSPETLPNPEIGMTELAQALGFRSAGQKDGTGPVAPPMPKPEAPPANPLVQPASATGAQEHTH